MDTIPPRSAGEGATPDVWGDLAKLPAQVVARDYPRQWADSGLAALDTPLETVWAAVQLALSGADLHTLASTLGLSGHRKPHHHRHYRAAHHRSARVRQGHR